jgi:regulator of PEP synthase PpsR (kinase-PPPase family)
MGMAAASTYSNPAELYAELEAAEQMIRHSGFHVVDVTDKPMEESAEEVIALVTRARSG